MSDLKQEVAKLALEYPEGSRERRKVQALLQEEPMDLSESERSSLVRLASSLPAGSEERRNVLRMAAGPGKFKTESGKSFSIRPLDFLKWLQGQGVRPGPGLVGYLRGKTNIPDSWLSRPSVIKGQHGEPDSKRTLEQLGATGQAFKAPRVRSRPPPEIETLWKLLMKALRAQAAKATSGSAGDYFVNMPSQQGEDEFYTHLEHISGDLTQPGTLEYALKGKAEKLYDRFVEALETGNYKNDGHRTWNLSSRKESLRELYSGAWYSGMTRDWEATLKKPRTMARLRAMRS